MTDKESNTTETTHSIPIGTLVEIATGARLFVVYHAADCDAGQTPLYSLSAREEDTLKKRGDFYNETWINGLPEGSLTVVETPRYDDKIAELIKENQSLNNEVKDLRAACEYYAEQRVSIIKLLS